MTTNDESTTGSRIFMSNLPYAWISVRQKKQPIYTVSGRENNGINAYTLFNICSDYGK